MIYEDLQKKTYPSLHSKIYTPPAQIEQTLYTQPGITYAQITNQNSRTPTNIEQDSHIIQSHQQTSVIQELTFKPRNFEAVVARDGLSLFK
jgi:hypothetical protein